MGEPGEAANQSHPADFSALRHAGLLAAARALVVLLGGRALAVADAPAHAHRAPRAHGDYFAGGAARRRAERVRKDAMPNAAVKASAAVPMRVSRRSKMNGAPACRKRAGIMSRPWRRP